MQTQSGPTSDAVVNIAISLSARAIVWSMARATIIVDVTHPAEVTASENWFVKWTPSLTFRSENQGCGCCVNIWDIEGTDEGVAALPPSIKGDSNWVRQGHRKPRI